MKKCYRCDIQFKDEKVKFCPYCGSPLEIDREWEAEERRKREEKEAIERKKALWVERCAPHIQKYQEINNRLSRFRFNGYKYREVISYLDNEYGRVFSYYSKEIETEEKLNLLISINDYVSTLLIALENNINSSNFYDVKKILDDKYNELKTLYNDLKFYKNNGSCPSIAYDFTFDIIYGGKFYLKNETKVYEKSDFDIAQAKGDYSYKGEEVSFYSIPTSDKQKYNLLSDYEYCHKHNYEKCEIHYYRGMIYKKERYEKIYYDFGYSGISDKINHLSSYDRNVNDLYLSYYADLLNVCAILRDIIFKIKNSVIEINTSSIMNINLLSFEKKFETKETDFVKTYKYEYYQAVKNTVLKKSW